MRHLSKKKENTDKREFTVDLNLIENFQFDVNFNLDVPNLLVDESKASGGDGMGPGASRLIGVAVGNFLVKKLKYWLNQAM